MCPQNHDRAVGRISHLPHAAASCLVHAALAQDPTLADLAGPGYRDSTRVAGGPEGMWTEILFDNRLEVMKGIRDLQNTLETLKLALERGERQGVEAILADARKLRSNHPITK
jgi:prephenate dehydrogenase